MSLERSKVVRGPDLLKILSPQTKLFDSLSSPESCYSNLSGPFSDVVFNTEVESKRKAKELYGKDLYTAFAFSKELKSTIEEIKKEMFLKDPSLLKVDSITNENFDEIKLDVQNWKFKGSDENVEVIEFLEFPDINDDTEKEGKEEEAEEKKKEKEGKDKKKKEKKNWYDEDDGSFFDTMSGYWRLLSVFDNFRISPPWYDAYAEGKEHWLQTKPIPPEVLENSRNKCLSWLQKYF